MTSLTLHENESLPMDKEYTSNAQEGNFLSRTTDTEEIQGAQRVTLEPLGQQQAELSTHLEHLSSSVTLPSAHLFCTTHAAHPGGDENEPFTQSPHPGAQVQMSLVDLVNYTRYAKRKADASNANEELTGPTAEERSTRRRLAMEGVMAAINFAQEDFDFSF